MPEVVIDKSGEVLNMKFEDLSPIFQGYVEAMFFTEASCIDTDEFLSDESQESIVEGTADGNIPRDAGWGDIEPDSVAAMQMDCFNFEVQARDLLQQAYATGQYDAQQAGRDFWFTRNGHGVGFWDREQLEPRDEWEALGCPRVGDENWPKWDDIRSNSLGKQLSRVAKSFGEVNTLFEPNDAAPNGVGYVYLS